MERRFSLEEDFMNHQTDDLIYGFMRGNSTSKEIFGEQAKRREYLKLDDFTKSKKILANSLGVSVRTVERHVEALEEKGLIKKETETLNDKEVWVYHFPYDYNGKYQLVDYDILGYLIDTRNINAIRIYIYLLSKYKWKKDYNFTIEEIAQAMGYQSTATTVRRMITNILESFNREGLIRWRKVNMTEYSTETTHHQLIKMELVFIASKKSELRPMEELMNE